jgi:hypothetical protein
MHRILGRGQHRIKDGAKSQRRQQQRGGGEANLDPRVLPASVPQGYIRPHGLK